MEPLVEGYSRLILRGRRCKLRLPDSDTQGYDATHQKCSSLSHMRDHVGNVNKNLDLTGYTEFSAGFQGSLVDCLTNEPGAAR